MKKSQGEIFGIALLFVIIILGIVIYGQYQASNPQRTVDAQKEGEYKLLAQSTLNSLKKMSTGCQIDSGTDSLEALITYCMDYSRTQSTDQIITCSGVEKNSCSYAIEILNASLNSLFGNQSSVMGNIPFSLEISTPEYNHKVFNGTYSNLDSFKLRDQDVSLDNYFRLGYKRVSSGKEVIPTQKRAVEMILSLYYR